MIPLTVCGTGSLAAWLTALGICSLGAAVGAIVGTRYRHRGLVQVLGLALFMGLVLPGLLSAGWFPFDPAWRYDCGATPDPNIEVYFATLTFPVLTVVFCLLFARRRRQS